MQLQLKRESVIFDNQSASKQAPYNPLMILLRQSLRSKRIRRDDVTRDATKPLISTIWMSFCERRFFSYYEAAVMSLSLQNEFVLSAESDYERNRWLNAMVLSTRMQVLYSLEPRPKLLNVSPVGNEIPTFKIPHRSTFQFLVHCSATTTLCAYKLPSNGWDFLPNASQPMWIPTTSLARSFYYILIYIAPSIKHWTMDIKIWQFNRRQILMSAATRANQRLLFLLKLLHGPIGFNCLLLMSRPVGLFGRFIVCSTVVGSYF